MFYQKKNFDHVANPTKNCILVKPAVSNTRPGPPDVILFPTSSSKPLNNIKTCNLKRHLLPLFAARGDMFSHLYTVAAREL